MRREIIPYNRNLRELAKKLRKEMTFTEKILWEEIKGKKLKGYDFDRQRPINNFIVDFYCKDLKLAIEIDGSSHIGKEEADLERQRIIESFGVTFLRFTTNEIENNMENVLRKIENFITHH